MNTVSVYGDVYMCESSTGGGGGGGGGTINDLYINMTTLYNTYLPATCTKQEN